MTCIAEAIGANDMTNKTIAIRNHSFTIVPTPTLEFSGSFSSILRTHAAILLIVLAVGLLDLAIFTANPGVKNDDAYIFFRYARNYVETGELTFNPGEKSVGYTSLAWMMVLAGTAKTAGLDPVTSAKAWALIFHLGSILFLYRLARYVTRKQISAVLVCLLYAMDSYIVANALSGMETAMGLCFYLAAMGCLIIRDGQSRFLTGMLLLVAVLTRPEYIVLVAAFIVSDILGGLTRRTFQIKTTMMNCLRIFMIPAAGALIYAVYLKLTMGFLTPSTYVGKLLSAHPDFYTGGFFHRMDIGFKSLGVLLRNILFRGEMRHIGVMILLGSAVWFIPVLLDFQKRRTNVMVFPFLAVVFHFILYFFIYPTGVWRYHLHVIPLIYLALVYGTQRTWQMFQEFRPGPGVSGNIRFARWVMIASLICLLAVSSREISGKFQLLPGSGAGDPVCPMAFWMNESLPADSVVAMDMIGKVGYYLDRPVFDLGGLIDPVMWPCLSEKNDYERLFKTLASKGVTHFLTCDGHILWNFLPAKTDNLRLVKKMPVSKGKAKMFRCFEIDYSVPLPKEKSCKSGSHRMPALEVVSL